jgi:hypothetical protein
MIKRLVFDNLEELYAFEPAPGERVINVVPRPIRKWDSMGSENVYSHDGFTVFLEVPRKGA